MSCTTDRTAEMAGTENVLNVYNWADYISLNAVEKFETEYGIKVNYDIYDSSPVVDVKLLTGNSGYDVVIHSSQFSSRLAPIGVYHKLDFSRLDNTRHLDPALQEKIDVYVKTRGYTIPYHLEREAGTGAASGSPDGFVRCAVRPGNCIETCRLRDQPARWCHRPVSDGPCLPGERP
jgi:hypothetical protein